MNPTFTPTILIVDGNEISRGAVLRMIGDRYPKSRLLAANDVAEAATIVNTQAPDIVVMMPILPAGDVTRLVKSISRRRPGSRFIIVASESCPEYESYALALGADHYICQLNPDTPRQLLDAVDNAFAALSMSVKDKGLRNAEQTPRR
jgi:DNA-binding NarL/FixJ family response regulator